MESDGSNRSKGKKKAAVGVLACPMKAVVTVRLRKCMLCFPWGQRTGHGLQGNKGDSVHPRSLATMRGGCLNLINLFFTYSCIVQMKSKHRSEPKGLGIHFRLLFFCTFWLEVSRKANGIISEEVPLTQQKLKDSGPVCLEFHTQERIWEGFMWPPAGLEWVWPWDCSKIWTVVLMCVRSATLDASPPSTFIIKVIERNN